MRAYHHFSVNHTKKRILIGFTMLLLPLFLLIAFSFITKIPFDTFAFALSISIFRLFMAYVFSLILAWTLVVLIVMGRKGEHFFVSLFDVMQSLPTFTILPIIISFFGQSEIVIFFFLVITIIWPIIFSIISSLKQADKSWHEAMKISKIGGFKYVKYYLFPVTLPGIVTGSIIGLGSGWEALIATELLIQTKKGLGPFFNLFSNNNSTTLFGVLVILSLIYAIDKLIWLPLLDKSHELLEV